MHPQFLNLLCCPETGGSLRLETKRIGPKGMVMEGELVSAFGRRYPIVRGIPRFVGSERYAASFGFEWSRWPRVQFEAENAGRSMEGHTTHMWESITQVGGTLQGRTTAEFGCGSGRFLDIVRRKGGRAVGMDLSMAVETARRSFADDPEVLVVQGDLFKPPFRSGVFDGGYTIGVLHHTPDPLGGVQALSRTVHAGGWVACSVYPRQGFYSFRSVALHRELNSRLKLLLGYWPALAYAYLSGYLIAPAFGAAHRVRGLRGVVRLLEENVLPSLPDLPDARWRVLDIFDAITPAIASTHTGDEVRNWLLQAGCKDVRSTSWGDTSVIGIRTSS
jgi:SAM-dependent methyltransferase/uncharacterized protein YbaR (Trm112 family)